MKICRVMAFLFVMFVVGCTELPEKGVFKFDNLLIAYNRDIHFIQGFRPSPGRPFKFYDDFPSIIKDNEENIRNVFGIAVSGPAKGEKMEGTISILACWWTWQGIYETFNHLPVD